MSLIFPLLFLQEISAVTFLPNINTTLLEIISEKNKKPRFNFNLEQIPSRFTPEDPDYFSGLLMESWFAVFLTILSFISLAVVVYLRMRYGYFGGKKLKNSEFTQFVRWTPGFLLTLSFLLFFLSGASLLIESQKISESSERLFSISQDFSLKTSESFQFINDYLINFNMVHSTDGLQFNTNTLKLPKKELKIMEKSFNYFQDDLERVNNRRVIVTLVVFCFGFIIFFIGILSFLVKIESLGYILAVSLGILMALDFLVLVPYMTQRVLYLDFCEQVVECDVENSIPVAGQELGYYFFDFSQESKKTFKQAQNEIQDLAEATQKYLSHYEDQGSSKKNTADLEESLWLNSLVILQGSQKKLEKLGNGFFIKKLCKDIDSQICSQGFGSFLVAEFIVIVLAISFGIGFFAGLLAPRVIERWRFEEDQTVLSKHNMYQIKT
jgi:hypothetical protein